MKHAIYEVRSSQVQKKRAPHPQGEALIFTKTDWAHVFQPHDNGLVVMLYIGEFDIKWVLIDTGNFVNILLYDAILRMDLLVSSLYTIHTPLVGFTGQSIVPKGTITLPLTLS